MERATVSRLALLQLPLAVPDTEDGGWREGERERGRERDVELFTMKQLSTAYSASETQGPNIPVMNWESSSGL